MFAEQVCPFRLPGGCHHILLLPFFSYFIVVELFSVDTSYYSEVFITCVKRSEITLESHILTLDDSTLIVHVVFSVLKKALFTMVHISIRRFPSLFSMLPCMEGEVFDFLYRCSTVLIVVSFFSFICVHPVCPGQQFRLLAFFASPRTRMVFVNNKSSTTI